MDTPYHKSEKNPGPMAPANEPPRFLEILCNTTDNAENATTTHITSKQQGQPGEARSGVEQPSGQVPSSETHEIHKIGDSIAALQLQDDNLNANSTSSRAGSHVSGDSKTSASLNDRLRDVVATSAPAGPPSIDGRSYTSGVASALDERESLRPDDSASVKARDDEEVSSIAGSGVAETKPGADGTTKAFRAQYQEISERMGKSTQVMVSEETGAPTTTNTLPIPFATALNANATLGEPVLSKVALPAGFTRQDPDEKLLEALESPRDRNFLLRLEQDMIEFVKESRGPTLDLEPSNSFYRLLSHRLADYYFLTHSVDHATSRVRIYRTPFCRLPPPLTGISNPPTSENTPPSSATPSVKIMRRGIAGKGGQQLTRESSSANSIEGSSKPTSEASLDESGDMRTQPSQGSGEQMSAKDKAALTREEREAKYKEARERIFKDFEEGVDTEAESTVDKETDVSRASSAAGKKKTGKRQRTPKDDSFEARSQFAAFYPSQPYMMHSGADSSAFPAIQPQMTAPRSSTSHLQPQIHYGFPQMVPADSNSQDPNAQWVPSQPSMSYGQPRNIIQPQNYGQNGSYSSHPASIPNSSPAGTPFNLPSNGMPMSPVPNQRWIPPQHQAYIGQAPNLPYNPRSPPEFRSYSPAANGVPQGYYPYGQLPSPGLAHQRAQHPLPGSYNRNAYNQPAQSFTPGHGNPNQGMYGSSAYPPVGRAPAYQQYGNHPVVPFPQSPSQPGQGPPAYNPSVVPTDTHRGNGPNISYEANGSAYRPQGSISNWTTPASLPARPSFAGQPPNQTDTKPSTVPSYSSTSQVPSN